METIKKVSRRKENWLQSPFCVLIVKVRNWFVTGMHLVESKDTSARSVNDIAEKIQHVVDIQKKERKRYCVPIKSVVV